MNLYTDLEFSAPTAIFFDSQTVFSSPITLLLTRLWSYKGSAICFRAGSYKVIDSHVLLISIARSSIVGKRAHAVAITRKKYR
jgi:hypothetical protein